MNNYPIFVDKLLKLERILLEFCFGGVANWVFWGEWKHIECLLKFINIQHFIQ